MVYLIALIIALPVFATLIVYIVSNKIVRHKKRAFHIAIHYTTILYVLSTAVLLSMIFKQQFIGIIIGLMLVILIGVIIYQWKAHTDIRIGIAVRVSRRIYFLLFFVSYFVLLIVGMMQRILLY